MRTQLGFPVLSTALLTAAQLQSEPSPLEGYGLDIIEWDFDANTTQTGSSIKFNGTAEEVWLQLLEINPNVGEVFEKNIIDSGLLANLGIGSADETSAVQKRQNWDRHFCWTFGHVYAKRVADGINYLRGVGGKPSNGPGPGNCGRVSCSHNVGIYWCNDAKVTKTLERGFAHIAEGAELILNNCGDVCGYTRGHAFHSTEWNVQVRPDSC